MELFEAIRTTRAMRRLDHDRPVPEADLWTILEAASKAATGGNAQPVRWLVVTDADKRARLGEIYKACWQPVSAMYSSRFDEPGTDPTQQKVLRSADHLGEHMGDAPVLVIACHTAGRTDGQPGVLSATMLGNILPATWSFMLAARARGLGTAWTTLHLMMEQQVAGLVGIPYAEVQQVCLTPVAHTVGTDFKPALRPDPDTILHWDTW